MTLMQVAGLVWYSEIFLNTAATAVVSVGVVNGTRATRTSVLQDEGAFTFNPGGGTAGPGALTQLNFQPTAVVGGAQLCVTHDAAKLSLVLIADIGHLQRPTTSSQVPRFPCVITNL